MQVHLGIEEYDMLLIKASVVQGSSSCRHLQWNKQKQSLTYIVAPIPAS